MRSLALLSALLVALPTWGMTKVSLFEVEQVLETQPVESVEAETDIEVEPAPVVSIQELQEQAQRRAMEQVIFQATGERDALNNEVIQKGIARSGRYVSQTSISRVDDQDVLRVVFNPNLIQSLLSQANIPYWPEERETLLVWVVEEAGYTREIAWDQMADPNMESIKRMAAERGLPIIVPVGDIQDLSSIEPTSLWGDFRGDISIASLRYPADAVVVVKIQGATNKRIRWTLYDDAPRYIDDSRLEAVNGESMGEINSTLENMVEEIARYYATKRAQKHSGEATGAISVQFEMISDAAMLFNIEKALLSLPSVAGVSIDSISGMQVDLTVSLIGDAIDFEREVSRIAQIRALEPIFVGDDSAEDALEQETQNLEAERPVEEDITLPEVGVQESTTTPVEATPGQASDTTIYWGAELNAPAPQQTELNREVVPEYGPEIETSDVAPNLGRGITPQQESSSAAPAPSNSTDLLFELERVEASPFTSPVATYRYQWIN